MALATRDEIVIYSDETQKYEKLAATCGFAVWLLDGRRLLCRGGDDDLVLLDTVTGESSVVFSSPREVLASGLGLAPDGREICLSVSQQQADIAPR